MVQSQKPPVRIAWAIAATLVMACASSTATHVPLVPVAEDLASLSKVERLGREMYIRDAAAWRATDALTVFGNPPPSRGAKGWIVVPDGDQWKVRFVTDQGSAVYDVRVDVHSTASPVVKLNDPPIPLSAEEAAMSRARETAAASEFMRCSENYNSVVLQGEWEGSSAWVVYLLAATTKPGEAVMGGHHRVHVSADGGTVLGSRPLTKSCLRLPKDENTEALSVMHLLDPEPIESHVFISLSHDVPLVVSTDSGSWLITGGRVWKMDK